MAHLIWNESYSVGCREIDLQHKGLLDLVNKIYDLDPNVVSKAEIFATLNALVKYAQTHFATEERILRAHHYPHFDEHHKEHEAFIMDVFRFAERLEKKDPNIHRKIVDYIRNWYTVHILGMDRGYKEFLASKGVV
ncbi:MAG TPA: bacteriohemerythrin [Bacteroidota bacterium]|nr:bacteriohemerythrin [Bacteroidota bacterium]